jgi:sugar phosphate isomerase/epimerase
MLNRRNFLKSSGAIGLSALFLPHAEASLFNFAKRPLGVQLFTLFDTIDADVQGSLKKVAAIGYTEIESAFSKQPGYYGMTPKQFAALCKSLGLYWKSHHVLGAPFKLPPGTKMPVGADGKPINISAVKNLQNNMQELVDQAAEGGISYLVCANTPTATTAEIKSSINVLTKTGEACKKAGLQLCYHNHDMEFKIVDGKTPYSMLLDEINPELLKFELDLAWATKAKVDIPAMFAKHEGRFPLLHIKDITADSVLGPVGSGIVDFKTVFANASIGGVKHYFVEHDMPKDAYASLTQSYKALRIMGL